MRFYNISVFKEIQPKAEEKKINGHFRKFLIKKLIITLIS